MNLKRTYYSDPVQRFRIPLKDCGVETVYINAVKGFYENYMCRIKVGKNLSEEFIVNKGLRQGCSLS